MSSASHSSTVVLAFGEGHRPLFSLPTRCSLARGDLICQPGMWIDPYVNTVADPAPYLSRPCFAPSPKARTACPWLQQPFVEPIQYVERVAFLDRRFGVW
jgi:hypothetical protein